MQEVMVVMVPIDIRCQKTMHLDHSSGKCHSDVINWGQKEGSKFRVMMMSE